MQFSDCMSGVQLAEHQLQVFLFHLILHIIGFFFKSENKNGFIILGFRLYPKIFFNKNDVHGKNKSKPP